MRPPGCIADHIRRVLHDGGSAPHAEDVQRFFKEQVASRGWRTAELRKVARRFHRVLLNEHGLDYLVSVADQLFRGRFLEETHMAVMLLERSVQECGPEHFRLFDRWLDRVENWSDHDALVHNLIGPMLADDPARAGIVFRWAKAHNRWRRRAACVALIRGVRRGMFRAQVGRVTGVLLDDTDDMVQKGLGWLLREYAKVDAARAVPLLMKIRAKAPRLVLRTACETLEPAAKAKVMAKAAGGQ